MTRYLRCGSVIDGTGNPPVRDGAVILEGDRIRSVGPAADLPPPEGADIIDLSGRTVLPGFTDVHLHLLGIERFDMPEIALTPVGLAAIRCVPALQALLEAGFTTVRDVASPVAVHLRDAVKEGSIPGPRILTARAIISQTGGHGDIHSFPAEWLGRHAFFRLADGPDDCRKAVREQFREGADLIKICTTGGVMSERDHPDQTQYSVEEVEAFVEEAHRLRMRVASHAHGAEGIKTALRGGVDTIEHGSFIDEEGIDLILEKGALLVPTLAIIHQIINRGPEMGVPEHAMEKARVAEERQIRCFRRAHEAGVPLAVGTDFAGGPGVRFGDNAMEIERLVFTGVSPLEALSAATLGGARAMGLEESLGTLEAGKIADIIALDGDPTEDIRAVRKVTFVMQGGEVQGIRTPMSLPDSPTSPPSSTPSGPTL